LRGETGRAVVGSESSLRVVVVGAGLAGLGAAWRLAREGCDVVLLERETRVGGRTLGTSAAGFALDHRVALLSSADRNLLGWIGELGLGDELLPLRTVELGQLQRGRVHAIDPRGLAGIARLPGVGLRDWARLPRLPRLMNRYRPLLHPEAPERAASLDFRSAADFGDLYFGKSLFERWIAPTLTSSYLSDERELSRVAFLLEWIGGREGAAIPGIAHAGLHAVAEAAAAELTVRHGCEVKRVEARGSGGFQVHWRAGSDVSTVDHIETDQSLEADAVVVATAAPTAGRIVASLSSPAERDFLEAVRYSPSLTLGVALDRPLTAVPQHVRIAHADGWPIEHYLLEPGTGDRRAPAGCGLVTLAATERFTLAHSNVADDVVEKALLAALERIYPRLRAVLRFTQLARCASSVPLFHVGAYRALERFQRVQVDRRSLGRRLYFAGDHLCGPRPESTLASGFRAARALLADRR
jgi:oxygen-dependent protoporphyrinogen oxidase